MNMTGTKKRTYDEQFKRDAVALLDFMKLKLIAGLMGTAFLGRAQREWLRHVGCVLRGSPQA